MASAFSSESSTDLIIFPIQKNLIYRYIYRISALIFLLSILSGCCFTDTCRVETNSTAVGADNFVKSLDKASVVIDSEGNELPTLTDPTAAIGIIIGEIGVLLDDLATHAQDLTADMRALVGAIEGSASQLLSEVDDVFGKNLDRTFNQLNDTEKRLYRDAQALLFSLKKNAESIKNGSQEAVLKSLREASIVAYDAEHNIPCLDKPPRLVYAEPSVFRLWGDKGAPGESEDLSQPDARDIAISFRGNYLNYGEIKASVEGISIPVVPNNSNGFSITLPDELIKNLQIEMQEPGGRFPRTLVVTAKIPTCKKKSIVETSEIITVKPPIKYSVTVRTTPVLKLPKNGRQQFTWYNRVEDCNGSRPFTNNHPVGPPARAKRYAVYTTSRNCNSYISQSLIPGGPGRGYKVQVQGKVAGCGKDCFLRLCNCRGRGWLGYRLDVDTFDLVLTRLATQEVTSTAIQNTYIFPYRKSVIPSNGQDLRCDFYSRIAVDDGEDVKIVELSREVITDPGGTGIHATWDDSNCEIGVVVPNPSILKDRRLN